MARELRIGLIGAGWMGKVHSLCYRMARQAFGPEPAVPVLAAVADVDRTVAERAASEFGYERAVADWRAIVEDPTIDIVDICTPNDLHYDATMAAIAAGKHVYCEKPLANSYALAREMTEAAQRAGVTTLVGFNYIRNPIQKLAREIVARGDIGEPNYVRLCFNGDFMGDRALQHTWRNDLERAGSGVVGDIGAHCLAYFSHVVDREIEEVFCSLQIVVPDHPAPFGVGGFQAGQGGDESRRIPNTTDDVATVMFRFSGGGFGHIEMSRVKLGVRFEIGYDVVGTAGMIRYDYERINDLDLYTETGPAPLRGLKHIKMGPSEPEFAAFLPVPGLGLGYNDFKAMEVREMLTAVCENRPGYPDFGFALGTQRTIEACVKSDAERRWVKLSEVG